MKTRLALLFGILLLLNACGGKFVEVHFIPDDYMETPENAGYLVGSIGYYTAKKDQAGATSNFLFFRLTGNDAAASLAAIRGFIISSDYKEADRTGKVFAIPLKPGDYEFYNVKFEFSGMFISTRYWAKRDFSAPFTVEKGKVHYAGDFLAYGRYEKNSLGISAPAGAYFVHTKNLERDREMLLAKYPELEGKTIENLDLKLNISQLIIPADE